MTRQEYEPDSDRQSLVDSQGRDEQDVVGELKEDPVSECANVMVQHQWRNSRQRGRCNAGAHSAVYLYTTEEG